MSARSPRVSPVPSRRRSTAVVAALLAAVLVVAGAAAPAAAATKLSVSGPTKINVGASATLKLKFSRNGKAGSGKVSLQARGTGGTWKTVERVEVSQGKARVKVKPAKTTTYRIKRGSKVSKVAKVKVAQSWIGFTVDSASVKAGSKVKAKIVLTRKGARSSGFVTIQRKTSSGWKTAPEGKVKMPRSGLLYVDLAPTTSSTTYRVKRGKLTSKTREVRTKDWMRITFDSKKLATSSSKAKGTVTWYSKGRLAKGKVKLQQKVGSGKWKTLRTLDVTKGKARFSVTPTTTRAYRVFSGSLKSPKQTVKIKSVIPKSFTIKGSGWGHGLGMSQYGAYAMAQAGKSVEDILTHYYTDTAVEELAFPTGNASANQLSVQIIGASPDNKTSVPVTVKDGGWRLRDAAGDTVTSLGSGKELTFKVKSGKVAAYQKGISGALATDSKFWLHWEGTRYYKKTSSKKTYVDVGGAHGSYRHGRLEVMVRNGKINIVNNLLLNTEYLYGIAEMPSSWGIKGPASLEAQAIAARNYAASAFLDSKGEPRKISSDCRCHIVDDTRDQNFTGWRKEDEGTNAYYGKLWKAAVDATMSDGGATGEVLRYVGSNSGYKGKLVTAYYSSSTGGATLNSEDAWAAVVPYIRSVDDPWSLDPKAGNPNVSWSAELTQSQARSLFGLSDVVSIKVSKTFKGGGVAELKATSSSGASKTISGKADAMRTRLNAAASGYVKSAWMKSFTPVGTY